MSTRYYHSAWRVYQHEILEADPTLTWSQSSRMVSDYIRNAGEFAHLRKFCSACYRVIPLIRKAQGALKKAKCPSSCPHKCPNHVQMTIEFPS